MNLKILYITLGILSTELLAAQNQTMEMSLEQVVKIARLESPDARTARHSFRSAYWNYKYYRANYLPSLSLSSDPNLNRAINKITMGDGSVKFVEQNLLNTDLTLNLSQNIPWTGGSLFLETSAQRMDLFSEHKYSWQTSPVMIGYRQSLFGYNSLKWDKRMWKHWNLFPPMQLINSSLWPPLKVITILLLSIMQMPIRSIVTLRGVTI